MSMLTPAEDGTEIQPRHDVAPGELFFSTTDGLGVITRANSVFVRLSRYPRDQLMGKPHNIIRHQSMPGGAFKLMWDTLTAGEPFCAYVDNRANGGSIYRVFATITPLDDGYLSVRCRPSVDALCSTAFQLYEQVRPQELAFIAEGGSAPAAAELGLGLLAGLLDEAGLTYEEFVWASLPLEVSAVLKATADRAERPDAEGQLGEALREVAQARSDLLLWAGQMDELDRVSTQLAETASMLTTAIEEHQETAEAIQATKSDGFNSALIYLRVWADIAALLEPILIQLSEALQQLRRHCALTRFRIALALLHVEALSQFVNEALDDVHFSADHYASVSLLRRALSEGVEVACRESQVTVEVSQQAARDVSFVADLITMPQKMISSWLDQASPDKDDPSLIDTVTRQREHTDQAWLRLSELIDETRRIAVPLDGTTIESHLDRIQALCDEIRPEDPPPAPEPGLPGHGVPAAGGSIAAEPSRGGLWGRFNRMIRPS